MHRRIELCASVFAIILAVFAPRVATAQEEIPPPSGKGRLVVVFSGAGGAATIRPVAARIAGLGYDVVLIDSLTLKPGDGKICLRAADSISKVRQMPHALPGKIGIVGFSLGGGIAFGFDCALPDDVAVIAAWYPETHTIKDVTAFANRIKTPTVMFAG